MRWKRVIRMQIRETNFHFLLRVHCTKQRMTPGWYICLKYYAPERNNANDTRQINSDCEHKQQSLPTQTQLTHKSEHKNQAGFWGIGCRVWGVLSFLRVRGTKNSFFHPMLEKAPLDCASFLRQRLIQKD